MEPKDMSNPKEKRRIVSHIPNRNRFSVKTSEKETQKRIFKTNMPQPQPLSTNIKSPTTSEIMAELSSSGGFQTRECKHAAKALEKRNGKPAVVEKLQHAPELCEEAFMKRLLCSLDENFFEDPPSSSVSKSSEPILHPTLESLPSLPRVPSKTLAMPDDLASDFTIETVPSLELANLLDSAPEQNLDEDQAEAEVPVMPTTPTGSARGQEHICDGLDLEDLAMTPTSPLVKEEAGRETPHSPLGHERPPSLPVVSYRDYSRCRVKEVSDRKVSRSESVHCLEKILLVELLDIGEVVTKSAYVHLLDDWALEQIQAGYIVNIIGQFVAVENAECMAVTVDKACGFLIVHPDQLITVTSIADATSCIRKSLLKELIRQSGPSDSKPSVMYGNMIHLLIQRCLARCVSVEKDELQKLMPELGFSIETMRQEIEFILRDSLEKLWINGIQLEVARKYLVDTASQVRTWALTYMDSTYGQPHPNATLSDFRCHNGQEPRIRITALADVEEDIISPMWGLRGKIDLSIGLQETEGPLTRSLVRPLELKSGKRSLVLEHDVQTMLYTLLMTERYDANVSAGILYYTSTGTTSRVRAQHNEIRAIIQKRNEVASILHLQNTEHETRATLHRMPPPIDDKHVCGRCFHQANCMLYNRAVEGACGSGLVTEEIFNTHTNHLIPRHCQFFQHWERLLTFEERESASFKRLQWTSSGAEREIAGNAFAEMVVIRSAANDPPGQNIARIQRWSYTFTKSGSAACKKALSASHLEIGSSVSISVEDELVGVSKGYIVDLTATEVTISCDRPLCIRRRRLPKFHPDRNQSFAFGTVGASGASPVFKPDQVFRIDKDEYANGLSKVRDNLIQMLNPKCDGRLARMIIDLEKPLFSDHDEDMDSDIMSDLNADQKRAVQKVLQTLDYTYIIGMPGSGKTTTIARLIKILVQKGCSVLIAAHTHSAVDNILLKTISLDIHPLRLGNLDKIHPAVRKFAWGVDGRASTLTELDSRLNGPSVVATTCLSLDHTLFARRRFDYCIVDEASQVSLPVCIGPLRFADRFVLVGDHLQLPPIVRSSKALAEGLEESLFKILTEAHPTSGAKLCFQYRMNEDIMSISNRLVYRGQLKCGSDQVASRKLVLKPALDCGAFHVADFGRSRRSSSSCWLQEVLDPERSVIFIDTDNLPALESQTHDSNEVEADLLTLVAKCLVQSGLHAQEIGVISAYRKQVRLLKNLLRDHKALEILTADKSQGRDKECILISLVRSNTAKCVGNLLADWRRMNVSFTRARSKLIIFGSRSTMQSNGHLAELIHFMSDKHWILTLDANDHLLHDLSLASPAETKREISSPSKGTPIAKKQFKQILGCPPRRRGILSDITNML